MVIKVLIESLHKNLSLIFFFKTLQLNSMYVPNFQLKYEVGKLTLIFM
jgi:hypothetical protein